MKAVKENKVYKVTDENKAAYLALGFDITDDNGKVIEHSPSSTVSRAEYEKLKAELAKAKSDKKADKNA